MLAPWRKHYDQSRQHIKKQRHYFANKGPSSQSYGFSTSHVWMWELDYKESWVTKNWCFWTVVLEKTLESPLDCKEIQPVYPEGNQSWIFIERTDSLSWNSNILATWCKELTHLKSPWCWDWLKVGGEGDDRGWDGWMASLTQWTWVWVGSGSCWWAGKSMEVLQSMELQRITHNLAIEHKFFRQLGGRSDFFQRVLGLDCFQLKIICMPETLWVANFVPLYHAAAAAKSLLSSNSVWPHKQQPTRIPRPWNSPGKNTGVGCHFLLQCMKVKSESEITQSCPTLSDPMDCSLPGSSVHGIFQAGVLEWGPIAFSNTMIVRVYF